MFSLDAAASKRRLAKKKLKQNHAVGNGSHCPVPRYNHGAQMISTLVQGAIYLLEDGSPWTKENKFEGIQSEALTQRKKSAHCRHGLTIETTSFIPWKLARGAKGSAAEEKICPGTAHSSHCLTFETTLFIPWRMSQTINICSRYVVYSRSHTSNIRQMPWQYAQEPSSRKRCTVFIPSNTCIGLSHIWNITKGIIFTALNVPLLPISPAIVYKGRTRWLRGSSRICHPLTYIYIYLINDGLPT